MHSKNTKLHAATATWDNARTYCGVVGGDLVTYSSRCVSVRTSPAGTAGGDGSRLKHTPAAVIMR